MKFIDVEEGTEPQTERRKFAIWRIVSLVNKRRLLIYKVRCRMGHLTL